MSKIDYIFKNDETQLNESNLNAILEELDSIIANLNNKADLEYTLIALSNKQDTLASGVNIRTVNGNSLLGSGNIDFPN